MLNKIKELTKLMSDLKNVQNGDMSENEMFENLGLIKMNSKKN
jgi:hypothetical protein